MGLGICFAYGKKEMMNMPAYKDSKTGTWFVKFYCKDWTGENKQIIGNCETRDARSQS